MQYLLYPRLPGPSISHRISEVSDSPVAGLPDRNLTSEALASYVYSATGGHKAGYSHLAELREALLGEARERGFPDAGDTGARRWFDVAAGRFLLDRMRLTPNEAARPGLWAFVSCDLVPDLVRWRFPGSTGVTAAERFADGVRNTFGRLWWRTYVLEGESTDGQSGSGLIARLGEDEIVQLMERPVMRANVALTRTVAGHFISTVEEYPDLPRMDLMRDARKRLNRLQPILCFEGLEQERLDSIVRHILSESVLSLRPPQADRDHKRRSWWERLAQRIGAATT
jgi:hypothetical protein